MCPVKSACGWAAGFQAVPICGHLERSSWLSHSSLLRKGQQLVASVSFFGFFNTPRCRRRPRVRSRCAKRGGIDRCNVVCVFLVHEDLAPRVICGPRCFSSILRIADHLFAERPSFRRLSTTPVSISRRVLPGAASVMSPFDDPLLTAAGGTRETEVDKQWTLAARNTSLRHARYGL